MDSNVSTRETLINEIEKTIEEKEEKDEQNFDAWFDSYVNSSVGEEKVDVNTKDDVNKVEVANVNANVNENETKATEEKEQVHEEESEQVKTQSEEVKMESKPDTNEEEREGGEDVNKEVVEPSLEPEPEPTLEDEEVEPVHEKPQPSHEEEQPPEPVHEEPTPTHEQPSEPTPTHEQSPEPSPEPLQPKKRRVKKIKHDSEPRTFSNGNTVEVSDKILPQPSDEEILQNIKSSKEKIITDINEQIKEMEANGNCKTINVDNYTIGSNLSNIFYQYILGKLFVPRNCVLTLDVNEYINNTTIFKYNAFDSPNVGMQHPIPEKIIFLNKLNNIFNHEFIKSSSGDFHFADLDKQLLSFIFKYKDYGTTKLEYGIIKSLLGKLIISLNTSCELALRDNTKPRINSEFKQAIIADIEGMKHIQSQDGKLFTSWKTFLNTLLSINADDYIYVHDNYVSLNAKLKTAYDTDFLTENLIANMLKCYLPSVVINYFYVIKSVYIIARLLSIYIQEKLYANKEFEVIINDIYTIGVAGVVLYENKSFIFKQMTRTLPKYDKEISEKTKLYILNHLLSGGQYYILKMFEESLPIVASLLTQQKRG